MKKVIAAGLVLLFVVVNIGTASADELEKLKNEQNTIKQQMDAEKKSLKSVQKEFNSLSEKVRYIENQLKETEKELANLNAELQKAELKVIKAEEELREIEEALQERVDIFKERLKDIYKTGDVSIFEVLTESTSLTDFLVRFELLKKIAQQDMDLVEEIDQQRLVAEEKKAEVEKKRDDVALLKEQSEIKFAQLEDQKKEQQEFLAQIRQDKATIEQALAELDADSAKLGNRIRQIQASRAAERAKKNPGSSSSNQTPYNGRFTWPTPGYTGINSDYGMRNHPVLRTKKLHTGIDIGAPMGSTAVAGDRGEVIFTGWFGAYGWTVVVDHGGGISTMYPHLSKITVKDGQKVSRGQEVGKVGTSGTSTGPHMHFEVRVNGEPVNPWPYLR